MSRSSATCSSSSRTIALAAPSARRSASRCSMPSNRTTRRRWSGCRSSRPAGCFARRGSIRWDEAGWGAPMIAPGRPKRDSGVRGTEDAQMSGTLYLVPNTLDFGTAVDAPDLQDVLPLGAIRVAARLAYWVAENARTTRAFLKRVEAVVPLAQALQALHIVEIPRPNKGMKTVAPDAVEG